MLRLRGFLYPPKILLPFNLFIIIGDTMQKDYQINLWELRKAIKQHNDKLEKILLNSVYGKKIIVTRKKNK